MRTLSTHHNDYWPLWEAAFSRIAPFINVLVYDGKENMCKFVQNMMFHDNQCHVMLNIILAHPDYILKDIENVKCICWEAVIVHCCQTSVLKHLKQLSTRFRMVILVSPLQDNFLKYKNLLSFLKSEKENDEDNAGSLVIMKARLCRHVAYERKQGFSNILEHWVPAYFSKVQLELYASILLANSSVLESHMATDDSFEALGDLILDLRQCCNHPCLVDEFSQYSPVKCAQVTDRMLASGKLLLLDKMLTVIRNRKFRVIVLFQSDRSCGNPMGDILEELVRHNFGSKSYDRIHANSEFLKKTAATDMFNDMTNRRFFFLIESNACLASIKLSSVDAVIIFDSDLDPLSDLKAIRPMAIKSRPKYLHIFRLYTPFTVEEKGLVIAKQGTFIDTKIKDIMPRLSHHLLSWGVPFLFSRSQELQQDHSSDKSYDKDTVFMDEVLSEFVSIVSTDVANIAKANSATISKAYMSGEFYSRNITLLGEMEGVSSPERSLSRFSKQSLDLLRSTQRPKLEGKVPY